MKIPDKFKDMQARVFQDKTVEHFLPVSVSGSLGTPTSRPADAPSGGYQVNVMLVTDDLKAQEWGLTVNRDAVMTASFPPPVEDGHFIRYNGQFYRVAGVQPFDAYTLCLLKAVDV